MPRPVKTRKRAPATERRFLSSAQKWFTGILTTSAAIVTLALNARNLGLSPWLGLISPNVADHATRRIVLMPRIDTLRSIGDSSVITATVTDARGGTLVGATLRWSSSDASVATVDSTGIIVARAPGRATIEAKVREVRSSAAVLVRQQPDRITIVGDSALRLQDGDSVRVVAEVRDARGHLIRGASALWQSADTALVQVDSAGTLVARAAGRTVIRASAESLRADLPVEVVLTPAKVLLVSGSGQRALAGRALTEPVVLQVLTRAGQAVPGTTVMLEPENGEGAVTPATAQSDAAGRVRAQWTLGRRAGVQRIVARVEALDSVLTVLADADPLPRNTRVEIVSAELGGPVAAALDRPVQVRVTDTLGTALASVRVAWKALDGGTVIGASQTDTSGIAEAHWTLGARAGSHRLLVQVGDARQIPATTVRALAGPGPARVLVLHGGDAQRGSVGRPLSRPISVLVRDSLGNAVPGAEVRARPATGSVDGSVARADSSGRASFRWTLGSKAGGQSMTLAVEGSRAQLRVTATARPQ